MLVFRAILHLGGSPNVIRAAAAVVAALAIVATTSVALRLASRITAYSCGLLMATVGASAFIESFTLAGELLSSLAAILSLLAFTAYLRGGTAGWLVLTGLLTGCAVMVKQSGFDAGLAVVALLLWRERGLAVRPVAAVVGSAAVPVVAGALAAVSLHSWWFAVVGYRGSGDSLVTGSFVHRLDLLAQSLPAAAKALGLLALLAAAGWRSSPLLVRLWLAGAVLGVLGGGNFHPHYYLQLVPPLSILAGVGVDRLRHGGRRLRAAAAVCVAAAIATAAVTVPVWFESPSAQAKDVWPHDPHLVHDAAVARYVREHTRPGQRVLVVWAAADVYYLADRAPAIPYMWRRNLEAIPGALAGAQRALAAGIPALVAVEQPPGVVDRSGRTASILAHDYRRVAVVDGVPIYRPRGAGASS
jgi:4-amino-4-deoxy-L-arabinose transferase-like glycosyltransferase